MLRLVDSQQAAPTAYGSLQAALAELPPEVIDGSELLTLQLAPGHYHERIFTQVPRLHLQGMGEDPADTLIEYDLGAFAQDADGEKLGTFRTPTFHCESESLHLENLTIQNSAGPGHSAGQAIALSLNAGQAFVECCRLLGDQDTLFLAPLPPGALQPKGFLGTELWRRREVCASVFTDCYIEGGVDFIFGGGAAWFERCEIFSRCPDDFADRPDGVPAGYLTAASTPEGQPFGLVFADCRLTSNCPQASVYLGRPWRDFARTLLLRCYIGAHIKPEGWHDWHKENAQSTVWYGEWASTGPGSDTDKRVAWSRLLHEDVARTITRAEFSKTFDLNF